MIRRSAETIEEDLGATLSTIVRLAAALPDVLDAEMVHILAQAHAGTPSAANVGRITPELHTIVVSLDALVVPERDALREP